MQQSNIILQTNSLITGAKYLGEKKKKKLECKENRLGRFWVVLNQMCVVWLNTHFERNKTDFIITATKADEDPAPNYIVPML